MLYTLENIIYDPIKANEKMIDMVVGLIKYLRFNKFSISIDATLSFFQILPKINICNYDEFYSISKLLFCNDIYTFEMFDRLFYEYIYRNDETYIKNIINYEKKKLEKETADKLEYIIKKIQLKLKEAEQLKKQSQKRFEETIDKKISSSAISSLSQESFIFANDKSKQVVEFEIQKSSLIFKKIANDSKYTERYKKKFEKLLILNLDSKNYEDINNLVFNQLERLNKIVELVDKKNNTSKNEEEAQKFLELQKKNLEKEQKNKIKSLTIKYGVSQHRTKFLGKGAVIDLLKEQNKSISNLSKIEYKSLIYYIKLNASKFRTKVSLSMKQSKRKVIDMKKTVQQGFKYGGIPIKLYYKKPIIKKYKLFCLFDISGSVSKYLGILTPFIMELNSVFNGGIEIYGFVNSIIDFTEAFKQDSIDQLLKSLKGYHGYSDYYTALSQFYDITYNRMDNNSIVLYFGDARNNKNETGVNFLLDIKSKTKYTVWLNPEIKTKWNTSDSIMEEYINYVDISYEINTVEHLIRFLNDLHF